MIIADGAGPRSSPWDAWAWWESRRLQYNLTLATGGCVAYVAAVALNYAFGHPVWKDVPGAAGMTVFLGALYLLVIGAANVCFLLGSALESGLRPASVEGYRSTAYGLGRWGSLIVPAAFPLLQLGLLLGHAR